MCDGLGAGDSRGLNALSIGEWWVDFHSIHGLYSCYIVVRSKLLDMSCCEPFFLSTRVKSSIDCVPEF